MSVASSSGNTHLQCKKCKAKVIADVKCVVCNSSFHKSCARTINLKISDENTVTCCEKNARSNDKDEDHDFFDAIEDIADSNNRIDVRIFNYVLKQKEIIIKELRDRIDLLNVQIDSLTHSHGSEGNRKTDQEKTRQKNEEGIVSSAKCDNSAAQREVEKNVNNYVTRTQVANAISETQGKIKMKRIINLNDSGSPGDVHNAENSENIQNKQNDGGWETVKKKRHYRKPTVIIGSNSSGVQGVEKRSFLHVSRVNPDTKVEDMESLLKVNFPGVTVEKWNSRPLILKKMNQCCETSPLISRRNWEHFLEQSL
ncbi:unnamed protein product [Callosobruchus maculatus]|uniref:Phorbol-ester/DAG-type domain-containing protein n=1 Tax=Callosobruchus maculatus TaxID=64391 RepID=A0A653BGJ4_CALMS|nr:unnamed protein product [Callosobruchus maculatus]